MTIKVSTLVKPQLNYDSKTSNQHKNKENKRVPLESIYMN